MLADEIGYIRELTRRFMRKIRGALQSEPEFIETRGGTDSQKRRR